MTGDDRQRGPTDRGPSRTAGSIGRWLVRSAIPAAALLVATGGTRAHGGETTGLHDAPLAVALFLFGVCLAATSVYLDSRGEYDRTYVDAGVFLGLAATLVGIAAYWI